MVRKFDNRLVILLLAYTFLALILDYTYPMPKREWLASLMTLGYWVCIFLLMFLLARIAVPEVFAQFQSLCDRLAKPLMVCGVGVTALMLAVNVCAGGDVRSPYTSFLSSFPIFFMVLLFDTVSIASCLKGAGIAGASLCVIYLLDCVLAKKYGQGIAVADETLADFLSSTAATRLATAIVLITAISNLLSIYFGSLKVPKQDVVRPQEGEDVSSTVEG